MKILTFRRFVGLAAIGGFAYVHKQRGGEWTLDSMRDTARDLWSRAMAKSSEVKDSLRESASRTVEETSAAGRSSLSDEAGSARPYSSYTVRDDEPNRH